jgi:hypothetical protein
MNVEIVTEAAQCLFWEYMNGIFRRSVVGARRLTCRSSWLFHLYIECSGHPLARTLATQCYVGLHLMNKELQRKPVKGTLLCLQN